MTSATSIIWDEDHDVDHFEGDPSDIPDSVWDGSKAVAAVVMSGLLKFHTPIWLDTRAAHELHEAGILDPFPENDDSDAPMVIDFDGVKVHLYVGPM